MHKAAAAVGKQQQDKVDDDDDDHDDDMYEQQKGSRLIIGSEHGIKHGHGFVPVCNHESNTMKRQLDLGRMHLFGKPEI